LPKSTLAADFETNGVGSRFRVTTNHMENALSENDSRPLPRKTTCYAWIHQPEELQRQTLETLAASPFNKIRFCVFPKRVCRSAAAETGSCSV
jgi:hypothetical protein